MQQTHNKEVFETEGEIPESIWNDLTDMKHLKSSGKKKTQTKPQTPPNDNEPSVLMHHAWSLGRATDKEGIVQMIKYQGTNTRPMRRD